MRYYKLRASYQKTKNDTWEEFEKILKVSEKERLLACENLFTFLKKLQKEGILPKGFYHYPCLYKATKEELKKK